MMISAGVDIETDKIGRELDINFTVMDPDDDFDALHVASVGWYVPLTLVRQDWKDWWFMVSRGNENFYGCVLGFYVRHLGDPNEA